MNDLSLNSKVDSVNACLSIGGHSYSFGDFYSHCQPYYPTVVYSRETKNSFETAFKVVNKLMEKKIIKDITLKQFIELVSEVEKLV